MSRKILIVEDESVVAEVLVDNLEDEGFLVAHAADGKKALEQWREWQPELVLLDVMLPHVDGFSICETMREEGDETPVLFLSAKGRPEDRVRGLASGGDDYLVKPFHLPELLLRVKNMLKRREWSFEKDDTAGVIEFLGHQVDVERGEVRLSNGQHLELHGKPLQLLRFFHQHEDQVVERDLLLQQVWQEGVYPSTRAIERHIDELRKIFEPAPQEPVHFHTLRGARFRFTKDPQSL
ncbi:MAG: DNA-binding response regulator [Deltaproteobacteria bacterium]|nr:DNA-binding response regulator [Deltaproteobacteria bacterium]|tara:strand:- start:8277 stop:8987 length:711 start_codon:yes stop_codon:yes gene_type:complete